SGEGDLLDRLGAIRRALDLESGNPPLEVFLVHLEQVRRDLAGFVPELPRDHRRGGTRHRRAAGGVRAQAIRRRVGVALLDRDVDRRDAKLLGHDLGEGGFVALALRLHTHPQKRFAGRVHAKLGAVEHAQAEDVELRSVPGAHHLGEAGDADAGHLALLPARLDVLAKLVVAQLLQGDVHGLRIVPAVIHPASRRRIRELLGLDEVLHPELRLVDPELDGRVRHQALDQIAGLGDSERAAVCDAARRLVRVVTVGRDVRRRNVVRAGDYVEEARLELRGLRVGEERAVVAVEVNAQREHLAVLVDGKVAGHVIVARETGRDEVFAAVLDPLHRPPDEQAGRGGHHVARIHRNLVSEAAPDIRRDDADLLLRQAGDQREDRANRMRSLTRHVDGGLARRAVDVRKAAARLQRRWMAARIEAGQTHDLVRSGECSLGCGLIARLPVVDVVVLLAFLVVSNQRRACAFGAIGARDSGQDLVVDEDGHVEHVLEDEIVQVGALSAQAAGVLLPLDGFADPAVHVGGGRHLLPSHRDAGMRWRRGLRLCPRPGGVLDRLDDVHVAGAAANVARDRPTDLFLARVGVALEQRRAHQHHARRAEAALQAVLFVEAGLDRRQGRALREALDSHDVAALHLDREQRARLDGFAIEEHRARAAAGRVATDMRARLAKVRPEEVDQQHPWLDVAAARDPVYVHRNLHALASLARARAVFNPRCTNTRTTSFLNSALPRT